MEDVNIAPRPLKGGNRILILNDFPHSPFRSVGSLAPRPRPSMAAVSGPSVPAMKRKAPPSPGSFGSGSDEEGPQPPPDARVSIEFWAAKQCWVACWYVCLAITWRPLNDED